jgi:hypothetical protein
MLGVAGCQQAPSDVGAANTETVQDGSPDGADLGDALVTVPDLDQPIDVRLWTLGPNPAGSPLSCDHNPTPSGTRLVPIYVNVTSDDPKHGAKDTSLKIAVRSGGVDRPLLLVTNYETYQSVCPEQPTVKVTGLDAGVQLVKRGVAVVSTTDRVATVIVSGTNGFTEQATIRVQPRHVTRRPDSPLVRDCAGLSDTVMPARLVLACGDGSIQAAIARWRTWYLNAASGRGRVLVNSCQPDCAGGRPVAYPAVFTLTSPTTVGSRLYFTELRIHFVGPAPGPRHSVTCPLATPRAIGGCVGPIYGR